MAKVISAENLAVLESEAADLQLTLPEIEQEVELYRAFMDGSKLESIINALKDAAPGLSRSFNSNRKVLVEVDMELTKLLDKAKVETEEVTAKLAKSKENKDRIPNGGAAKSGYRLAPVGEDEIPVGSDLASDFKFLFRGFSGTVPVQEMSNRYNGGMLSEIDGHLGEHWNGNDLRVKKDKAEYIIYKSATGSVFARKG